MVPFGPDPLFHKNYGGLSAIDQKLLPVVWSSFGACVRADALLKGFSLANDLYFVQGFDVSARDQALNMQSDLQAYDGARGGGRRPRVHFARASDVVVLAVLESDAVWPQPVYAGGGFGIWRPAWPVVNRLALA